MQSQTDSAGTRPSVVLVLIHGTWARDAQWLQPGSPLRTALDLEFPGALIQPFRWSGANSAWSRVRAARALREFIQKLEKQNPSTPQFIVAHSHGGNVALRALGDEESTAGVAGIVCLATPFIHVQPRDWGGPRGRKHFYYSLLAALPLATSFFLSIWLNLEPTVLLLLWVCLSVVSFVFVHWYRKLVAWLVDLYLMPSPRETPFLILQPTADEAR